MINFQFKNKKLANSFWIIDSQKKKLKMGMAMIILKSEHAKNGRGYKKIVRLLLLQDTIQDTRPGQLTLLLQGKN
jgi:ATP-dependent RNA circularization protein (DNA/RNA ligase family)